MRAAGATPSNSYRSYLRRAYEQLQFEHCAGLAALRLHRSKPAVEGLRPSPSSLPLSPRLVAPSVCGMARIIAACLQPIAPLPQPQQRRGGDTPPVSSLGVCRPPLHDSPLQLWARAHRASRSRAAEQSNLRTVIYPLKDPRGLLYFYLSPLLTKVPPLGGWREVFFLPINYVRI